MADDPAVVSDGGVNVRGDFAAAADFDPETGLFSKTKSLLWWMGWRWVHTVIIGMIIGFFVGIPLSRPGPAIISVFTLLGAVGGGFLWYRGAQHINEVGPKIVAQFHDIAPEIGRKQLNISADDVQGFTFTKARGTAPSVDVSEVYRTTVMLVGDTSVALHGGVVLDMRGRGSRVNDDSRELYYDQITGVSYENDTLRIRTSSGDDLTYPSTREPTDALEELQNRVREYKTDS